MSDRDVAGSPPGVLLWASTVALTGVVLLRCVVGISPDLYWDIDPRSPGAEATTFLGPAGAIWLDTLTLVLAGVALAAHILTSPLSWDALSEN